MRSLSAGCAAAVLLAGCSGGGDKVARLVDGRVVVGEYVAPDAYAAYLRGVVAAEAGDLAGGIAALQDAASHEPDDPEIWARLATVRCRRDPRDPAAREAIDRALALDAAYAGAWAADSACAEARGDAARAASSATRAADGDPGVAEIERRVARGQARTNAASARARLVALTLVRAQSPGAWEALAAWGEAHGDAMLVARALAAVAAQRTDRRGAIAKAVVALEGAGEITAARALAGALVDLARDGAWARAHDEPSRAAVARLAVDGAILARNVERVRLRATRMSLPREEAAARAMLLGDASMARELAEPVLGADPEARGARLVLAAAAADRGDAPAVARALGRSDAERADAGPRPVSMAILVAFGRVLARHVGAADATTALDALARGPLAPGDTLVTPLAVDLVARGLLPDTALSADGRIELALRRGDAAPDAHAAHPRAERDAPDARHQLALAAAISPKAPATRALAARLASAAASDTLVAASLARIASAEGAPAPRAVAERLDALAPIDPLAAAASVALAERRGDRAAAARARSYLAALAATRSERALARGGGATPLITGR